MSITIDLPAAVEEKLRAEAARLQISVSEYALRVLSAETVTPANGAELVAYWQSEGVIGTRPDITDSQAYARRLRQAAENRNAE
jgi:hypothetical protein